MKIKYLLIALFFSPHFLMAQEAITAQKSIPETGNSSKTITEDKLIKNTDGSKNQGKDIAESGKENTENKAKTADDNNEESLNEKVKTKQSVFDSSDEFKPSEDVSEDLSIPFPVDI